MDESVDGSVPHGQIVGRELSEGEGGSVVDQHVDGAETVGGRLDHGLDLTVIGHVGGYRQGLHSQRFGVGRGAAGLIERGVVVDDNVGAGPGQGQGDASTNPLCSPGDQSRPAGKIHHGSMPPGQRAVPRSCSLRSRAARATALPE